MSSRYLTHFGTVLFVHLLLILGSVQLFQTEFVQRKIQTLGPQVIKMRVASEVLTVPLRQVTPVPTHKTLAPTPVAQTTEATTAVTEVVEQASGVETNDIRLTYKAELRAKIDQNKFYPVMSRRLGQTGIVVVAFTLLEDGNIINVRIDKPSPFEKLNIAGLEAVKKVQKFKPIPKELGTTKMDIKVPVKFYTI